MLTGQARECRGPCRCWLCLSQWSSRSVGYSATKASRAEYHLPDSTPNPNPNGGPARPRGKVMLRETT